MVARVVSASQGGASRSATRSSLAWRSSLAFGAMLQLCRDRSATTYHLDATTTPMAAACTASHRSQASRARGWSGFPPGSHVVKTICSM
jgi:hypothetical protein